MDGARKTHPPVMSILLHGLLSNPWQLAAAAADECAAAFYLASTPGRSIHMRLVGR